MEWQPIETAPKDGSVILAYWEAYLDGKRIEGDNCYALTKWSSNLGLWISIDDEEFGYMEPSHFMPLPPPPEQNK